MLERLGQLNDLAMAGTLPDDLRLPKAVPQSPGLRKRLLRKAEREFERFLEITPFWK